MPRFETTPPMADVPRATDNLPEQANRPDDFELPVVEADPRANLPEEIGPPEGLPLIPVVEMLEDFPDDLPDAALDHLPWA